MDFPFKYYLIFNVAIVSKIQPDKFKTSVRIMNNDNVSNDDK